jgi:hypothetical protein
VLTTKDYQFTNAAGGALFAAGNYSVDGQPATTPPTGNGIVINGGASSLIVVTATDTTAPNKVGNLTVENYGQVQVGNGVSLSVTGNLDLDVPAGVAGLQIQNASAVNLTNTAGATVDAGAGSVQLTGGTLNSTGDLTLLSGTVSGNGTLSAGVTHAATVLHLDGAAISASGGTLNVTAQSIVHDRAASGGTAGTLQAAANSGLIVTTPAGSGIDGGASTNGFVLNAGGANSIVQLNTSSLNNARVSAGSGVVQLARSMTISNITIDAGGSLAGTNAATVSMAGTLTNNGSLTATNGTSLAIPDDGSLLLTGTGVLNIQGATFGGPSDTVLTNDLTHTIAFTGNVQGILGADGNGNGPTVTNNGTIVAMGGQATGTVAAKTGAGSFVNNGTMRGYQATLTLTAGTFDNEGVFDAGQTSFDSNGYIPPQAGANQVAIERATEDLTASVDGADAALNNVGIDVNLGVLRSESPRQQFTIYPSVGTTAQISSSTILADYGGILTLTGTPGQPYELYGTTVIAREANSAVRLDNIDITAGTLMVENGGTITELDNLSLDEVNNAAALTTPAGKTLTLSEVTCNVGGSISVNGTLLLDGTTPIGGTPYVASGSDVLGGNVTINKNGLLQIIDQARIAANFTINGTVRLAAGELLTIAQTSNNTSLDDSCNNPGTFSIAKGGGLVVTNPKMTNTGSVDNQGTITAATYQQVAGTTTVHGAGIVAGDLLLEGGLLTGDGEVTGAVAQTAGTFEPGVTIGTFTVGNGYSLSGGVLYIDIASLTSFDQIDVLGGNISLVNAGDITLDLSGVPANDPLFSMQLVGFQIFGFDPGQTTITDTGVDFTVADGGPLTYVGFDTATGTAYLANTSVPEPGCLVLAPVLSGLALKRRRNNRE